MAKIQYKCIVCGSIVEKQCCACGNTKSFTKMPMTMVEETESTIPGAVEDTEAREFEEGGDNG